MTHAAPDHRVLFLLKFQFQISNLWFIWILYFPAFNWQPSSTDPTYIKRELWWPLPLTNVMFLESMANHLNFITYILRNSTPQGSAFTTYVCHTPRNQICNRWWHPSDACGGQFQIIPISAFLSFVQKFLLQNYMSKDVSMHTGFAPRTRVCWTVGYGVQYGLG